MAPHAAILDRVPESTLAWLLDAENPSVAMLTREQLLGERGTPQLEALSAARNSAEPIASILAAQLGDGSWAVPSRDYQKYGGSLWQVHFLGELHADAGDERVRRGVEYALSRQMDDGSWSTSHRPAGSIQCLTANVGRAIARLGHARDERMTRALSSVADAHRRLGALVCSGGGSAYSLNGYCHMLAPKLLLFLGEVPREIWPAGAAEVRDAAVAALRDKQVYRCLPSGSGDYFDTMYTARKGDLAAARAEWLATHDAPEYAEKPGWLRFGFPLSYNSDVLESLSALMAVGERRRSEYEPALQLVEAAADDQMRWKLRQSFNGKMLGNVEAKGKPSRWLTLRALRVLDWFATADGAAS